MNALNAQQLREAITILKQAGISHHDSSYQGIDKDSLIEFTAQNIEKAKKSTNPNKYLTEKISFLRGLHGGKTQLETLAKQDPLAAMDYAHTTILSTIKKQKLTTNPTP